MTLKAKRGGVVIYKRGNFLFRHPGLTVSPSPFQISIEDRTSTQRQFHKSDGITLSWKRVHREYEMASKKPLH